MWSAKLIEGTKWDELVGKKQMIRMKEDKEETMVK